MKNGLKSCMSRIWFVVHHVVCAAAPVKEYWDPHHAEIALNSKKAWLVLFCTLLPWQILFSTSNGSFGLLVTPHICDVSGVCVFFFSSFWSWSSSPSSSQNTCKCGLAYVPLLNWTAVTGECSLDLCATQDSSDQCPMPINADQNHGIDPKCLSIDIGINARILIGIDRHWALIEGVLATAGSTLLISSLFDALVGWQQQKSQCLFLYDVDLSVYTVLCAWEDHVLDLLELSYIWSMNC